MGRWSRWLVLVSLVNCSVKLDRPPDSAVVECETTAECPGTRVCVQELDRCFARDASCIEQAGGDYRPAAEGSPCTLPEVDAAVCSGGECAASSCGDGVLDLRTEACDAGPLNSDTDANVCRRTCVAPACGDFVEDDGELCDDGNTESGDGCRADCAKAEICGDDDVDQGEACDDGNTDSGDGCRGDCSKTEFCGDDFTDAGEACDDGNTTSGDGCRADCGKVEVCGDARLDAGEECDDGNSNPNDGCASCTTATFEPTVLVGLGAGLGDPGQVVLDEVRDVVIDGAGDVLVSSAGSDRVLRISQVTEESGASRWVAAPFAGTGIAGGAGDGGHALGAQLDAPSGLALDGRGNVYIAEEDGHRVRRVDALTGVITTAAGTGVDDYTGDGWLAVDAALNTPRGLAVDGLGNLFIADYDNAVVRRVDGVTGVIDTVAWLPGVGVAVPLRPADLTFGPDDQLYIADRDGSAPRVWRLDGQGLVWSVAGGVACVDAGPPPWCGDGSPATAAQLGRATGLAFDLFGNLLVVDGGLEVIRRVDAVTGDISTIAGTGLAEFSGDGGPAVAADFDLHRHLNGITVDATGRVWVADQGTRVRCISEGVVDSCVGVGGTDLPSDSADVGATPTALSTAAFTDVVTDIDGNALVADRGGQRILHIATATGLATRWAGTGLECLSPFDDCRAPADALEVPLMWPDSLEIDTAGNLYMLSSYRGAVHRVDAQSHILETVVPARFECTTVTDPFGDGGDASLACLHTPDPGFAGLAIDGAGNLFIADTEHHRIRRIDALTNIITTVAPAAGLSRPMDVAVDGAGGLYVADTGNHVIRHIDAGETVTVVAGTGDPGFSGDGPDATAADLNGPTGVDVDGAGNLYIADTGNYRVRRVDPLSNAISTIVGTGQEPAPPLLNIGDGGDALEAVLTPYTVTVLADGSLVVGATRGAGMGLSHVDGSTGILTAMAASIDPSSDGALSAARLGGPLAAAALPGVNAVVFPDSTAGVLRHLDWDAAVVRTVAGYPLDHLAADVVHANTARYSSPLVGAWGVAFAQPVSGADEGWLFVSAAGSSEVRRLELADAADPSTWRATTLLTGPGYADGNATDAEVDRPSGLAYNADDPNLGPALYIADSRNQVIRALALSSDQVITIAGTPRHLGFRGDFGDPASDALFFEPHALAVGPAVGAGDTLVTGGTLYVADTGNHRVRAIDLATGTIATVVGDGTAASSGTGAPARQFSVALPNGLLVDPFGNLFISSRDTVRRVAGGGDGVASGEDAVSTVYGEWPRAGFPERMTDCLAGLLLDPAATDASRIWVLDSCQGWLVGLERTRRLEVLTVGVTLDDRITSDPIGIDCGATCEHRFPQSATVTLTAVPGPGRQLVAWSGCTVATGDQCEVDMSLGDVSVTAELGPEI